MDSIVKALRCCVTNYNSTQSRLCNKCPYKEYADGIKGCENKLKADAADAIEELIPRLPKWISVNDELPSPIHPSDPDYRPYLIIADGYMYVADYSYDKYFETCYSFYVDGEAMTGVTHWMKLPVPPKGE